MTFMRTKTLRNGMKRHNESRDISTKGGRMLPNCQDTEECWDAANYWAYQLAMVKLIADEQQQMDD